MAEGRQAKEKTLNVHGGGGGREEKFRFSIPKMQGGQHTESLRRRGRGGGGVLSAWRPR